MLSWWVHPQIKQLEDRLSSCEAQRELTALRRKLDLVEEEKREYSDKCSKTEVEVKDLRFTGEDIFGKCEDRTRCGALYCTLQRPAL